MGRKGKGISIVNSAEIQGQGHRRGSKISMYFTFIPKKKKRRRNLIFPELKKSVKDTRMFSFQLAEIQRKIVTCWRTLSYSKETPSIRNKLKEKKCVRWWCELSRHWQKWTKSINNKSVQYIPCRTNWAPLLSFIDLGLAENCSSFKGSTQLTSPGRIMLHFPLLSFFLTKLSQQSKPE